MLLIRRIGGVVLAVIGGFILVGPLQVLIGGLHGAHSADERHGILDAMIYQFTLGGVLILFGAYFITKKPRKSDAAH
jgi:hypothetical protein